MLRHEFIRKVISQSPNIVNGKKFDYQVLEDKENYYLYRIPFMEEKQLFTTIPKMFIDSPVNWINHIYHGNQFYYEDGTPRVGGTYGRYPGCGIGNWKGSLNNPYVQKIRKQNILFLC